MIALAAIVLQAQAAVFAPPLGVPLRIVTERVQDDETGHKRFRVERLIRFAREGQGYRAEAMVIAADAEGSQDASAMFEAGFARLIGRTIVFHLDAAGKTLSVDAIDAQWAAFCEGVAAIVAARKRGTRAERAALAERIAGPLRALPPERRLAILASLVDVLVFREPLDSPGTVRRVRLPGKSPFGGPISLEGTRRFERAGALTRVTTSGSAALSDPAGEGHIDMAFERDVDPSTGLIAAGTETVTTRAAAKTSRRVSTIRVELLPASAWPAS